jgi:hypothetical protein
MSGRAFRQAIRKRSRCVERVLFTPARKAPRTKAREAERRETHPGSDPATTARPRALSSSPPPFAGKVERGPARLSALHCGCSSPGRASWDYRVQTGGPSPAPVQRAPRSPVTRRTGRCPSRLQGKSDELRLQAPHPLRQSASPVTSLTTSRMPPLCRAKESRQGL